MQKLAQKSWRFELFYWDYVIGIVLMFVIFGLSLGSIGQGGRSFVTDLGQADIESIGSAFLGGIIWCVGMSLSIIAAGEAGFAISYGLGQGATMVAAIWGLFIWKEFKGVRGVSGLLFGMFLCFLAGLALIIYAGS